MSPQFAAEAILAEQASRAAEGAGPLDVVALILAVLAAGYLLVALLRPEAF